MFVFFPELQLRGQAAIPGTSPSGPRPESQSPSRQTLPIIDSLDASPSASGAPAERHLELQPRQNSPSITDVSTCGYLNGNSSQSRTANPGFDCRVDTKNAIWGFCPTTVITPSDCGLVGACIDSHACKSTCGISGVSSVTTFSWWVSRTNVLSRSVVPNLVPKFIL